ncbi:MAG: M28 family metallopeptidase [Bacteriovoracaceae bacterium]
MFKWIIVASFSISAFARAPGSFTSVRTELEKVSQKDLISTLNSFIQPTLPSRMVGKPGHDSAVKYIEFALRQNDDKNSGSVSTFSFRPDLEEGKNFYQRDFDTKVEGKIPKSSPEYQKWLHVTSYLKRQLDQLQNTEAHNIVWEKKGLSPKKILVITAHYDTIVVDPATMTINANAQMPGANYNGTGVAMALSLVKVLSQIDLNYTVRVVFLDWQAIGYLGSYHYAKALADDKKSGNEILGVMNLEMLGQDTSYFDKTKKTGNMVCYGRNLPGDKRWANQLIEKGTKMGTKVNFELKANDFDQSDTFRFWDQGFQAVTFSQNWEDDFNPKFYQTPQDTAETLNHETFYGAYKFIGGAVLSTLLDITR